MIKLKEFLDDTEIYKNNFYIYYDEHYEEKLLIQETINEHTGERYTSIANIEYIKELIKESDNITDEFIKEKIKENHEQDLLEDDDIYIESEEEEYD